MLPESREVAIVNGASFQEWRPKQRHREDRVLSSYGHW
jgi:hypothetical protein